LLIPIKQLEMVSDKKCLVNCVRIVASLIIMLLPYQFCCGQNISREGKNSVSGATIPGQRSDRTLELLFDGIIDLYYYRDLEEEHYLIVDRSNRNFTISIRQRDNGSSGKYELSQYPSIIPVLKACMPDAPIIHSRMDKLIIDKESLTDLVHDYHVYVTGSDLGINYQLQLPLYEARIGVVGAYVIDLFEVNDIGQLSEFTIDPSGYPRIGLTYTSVFPRLTRRVNLDLCISVADRSAHTYLKEIYDNSVEHKELYVNQLYLQLDIIAAYTLTTSKIKPSLFFGFAVQRIIDESTRIECDYEVSDLTYGEVIWAENEHLFMYTNVRQGMVFGSRFSMDIARRNKVFCDITYSRFFGDEVFSSINSIGISTGLLF